MRRLLPTIAAAALLVAFVPIGVAAGSATPTTIQAVYAVPSDGSAVAGRHTAIADNVVEVQDWFAGQTNGVYPVFTTDGGGVSVVEITLPATGAELAAMGSSAVSSLVAAQLSIEHPETDRSATMVVIEGADGSGACGYAGSLVVIPIDNCGIEPLFPASFPYGMTYLLAHELTHLLGAVPSCAPNALPGGHVSGDNRDILYQGGPRDWNNLMLDPGRDDYYQHGNPGCTDIADSPLLGTVATNGTRHTCAGLDATIVGTTGDDSLVGTAGPDVIVALAGNDTIDGGGGHDVICAGPGTDIVHGGDGNDTIEAGDGNDRVWGGMGRDTIDGGPGRDSIVGGSGVDILHGGVGTDRLKGSSASDFLYGENGRDRLLGGNGNDQIRGGGGNDHLYGGEGVDSLNGGAAYDRCTASGGEVTRCEVVS